MHIKKCLLVLSVAISVCNFYVISIAGAASIILSLDNDVPIVGDSFSVEVLADIDPSNEIIGFGFDLLLSGTGSLNYDGFLPNIPLFVDDSIFLAPLSDDDGIRGASAGNLLFGPPVSGNSILLGTLWFTPTGPGDVVIDLGADDLTINATEGFIPTSGTNYMPTITAAQVKPVPIPGSVLLFGVGLLVLVGLKKKVHPVNAYFEVCRS